MMYGKIMASARPCDTWKIPPIVCAIECTIPSDTLVNAIPATIDACTIISLAFKSLPFSYATGKVSIISWAAWLARISDR